MASLKIETVNISELKAYSQNPKDHPEKQIQQIAASIKEFGFNTALLIDETNEIIAGHGRLEAAKILQLDTVPVIRLSHLSEAQKRAYRLADNKIAENGGWNTDLLRLEISELEQICNDFDITITGFEDLEIDVLTNPNETKTADEQLNKIPYVPENEIVSKIGDIWTLVNHKIICGNSLESYTFQNLMGNKLADMILQDPPYDLKIGGHVCKTQHKEFAMASGEMNSEEFTKFLKSNFAICEQYLKDGGLSYNYMDWRHIGEIIAAGRDIYKSFINMVVWVKSSGGMGSLYRSQHELCFVFKKGKESHTNNVELGKNGRYRTNVWHYAGVNSFGRHKDDIKMHPTVKPVEMLRDAILDVTKRGDIVLDSFLGSGSTLIAAEKSKRICYGIEFEPLYIDTTIRRFKELFGIDAIRESDGKTYSEILSDKLSNQEVSE